MNIYDMYFVSIYTVVDIKYNNNYYKTEYTRDALVLKRTRKNRTYYIDLFTKNIIKEDIYDCEIGDEFIVKEKRYEPIINYLDQNSIKKPNMSKSKIFKMLLESNKKGEK